VTGTTPGLRVREAVAADAELLAELIEELNRHQREPTGHVTAAAVRRDGFGPAAPEFKVLLAELDGAPAGYALYHPSWSTEHGERGLYVYDLYVREGARGHGAGRALMAAVAARAKAEGRTFLWWCSKPWNREAQEFYARLGGIEEEIRAHAIFGAPFEALAAADRPGPGAPAGRDGDVPGGAGETPARPGPAAVRPD
jgi:GNAT superfamily N-acetyltransferase